MKKNLIIIGSILLVIIIGIIAFRLYTVKDIKNTSWELTGWNVSSLNADVATITLNFKGNKISGNGGVNSYGGDYKIGSNKRIILDNIFSTEMASMNPDINRAESLFFASLILVRYYEVDNNVLKLFDKNNNTLLIFEKV